MLLCSNCHKIVHRFSSKKYKNKDIYTHLSYELNNSQIEKVQELANRFIESKKDIRSNGNIVKDPYSLVEAIKLVSVNNGFTTQKKTQLKSTLLMILNLIPKPIFHQCSFRLLKKGKYISINLMNYLLFRTPRFGDLGEIPVYERLISLPDDEIPERFHPIGIRESFYFKHASVVNIGLSFKELLNMSVEEKLLFSKACEIFSSAKRTRDWVSNIDLSYKQIKNFI